MKVSLNWVKQFTDIDISTDELVKKIGEQLGAVEEVVELGPKYEKVVIAEVKQCVSHPNADKLSVCLIDDGGVTENVERKDGLVEVVCGAPNVRQGIKVAWLPPGATVPSTFDTDPFVLEARELRGVVSNGMIASAKELAIGDEHDGILEIDVEASPGQAFADVYQLNDTIIDIENKMFTHRPDCFGQLGVAREIAGICHKQFTSPDWYLKPLDRIKPGDTQLPLTIQNDIPDIVPRFVCVALANVNVQKSPVMVQSLLARVGIKPINNIVDITNYLMMLTGQPLHAYDYDKLAERTNAEGVVLKPTHGDGSSKVRLLNGKEVTPREQDIVIATDSQIVGVGGVMGGADTEVDETTKNIVLECANFDMYTIRRTSMGLGLFTDAVSRFNKGQSSLQQDTVLEEAVAMVQSLAQGIVASEVQDAKGEVDPPNQVELAADFIGTRLGEPVNVDDIKRLLSNVEFDVNTSGDVAQVTAPFWRTDIEIREDIVEEIGRLMGFHHLPIELPERSVAPVDKNHMLVLKSQIRDNLSAAGANELLTYSFVHGDLLSAANQDETVAFKVSNALSPDLQYYRLSLTPSLLEKVYGNIRSGYDSFMLYEIGKCHIKGFNGDDNLPREEERVAAVCVTINETPAYFEAKNYATHLLESLGIKGVTFERIDHPFEFESGRQCLAPYDIERTAVVKVGEDVLGIVGELSAKTRKALKLPQKTAAFELAINRLAKTTKVTAYKELSKFPSVQQDISLKVPKGTPFSAVFRVLTEQFSAPEASVWQFAPLDIYQKDDTVHMTFRLTIASKERTLTADEVNKLLDDVASKAHETLKTERI